VARASKLDVGAVESVSAWASASAIGGVVVAVVTVQRLRLALGIVSSSFVAAIFSVCVVVAAPAAAAADASNDAAAAQARVKCRFPVGGVGGGKGTLPPPAWPMKRKGRPPAAASKKECAARREHAAWGRQRGCCPTVARAAKHRGDIDGARKTTPWSHFAASRRRPVLLMSS